MSYRGYEIHIPNRRHIGANYFRAGKWYGSAMLKGMPDVEADSEADLRQQIDAAHDRWRDRHGEVWEGLTGTPDTPEVSGR